MASFLVPGLWLGRRPVSGPRPVAAINIAVAYLLFYLLLGLLIRFVPALINPY